MAWSRGYSTQPRRNLGIRSPLWRSLRNRHEASLRDGQGRPAFSKPAPTSADVSKPRVLNSPPRKGSRRRGSRWAARRTLSPDGIPWKPVPQGPSTRYRIPHKVGPPRISSKGSPSRPPTQRRGPQRQGPQNPGQSAPGSRDPSGGRPSTFRPTTPATGRPPRPPAGPRLRTVLPAAGRRSASPELNSRRVGPLAPPPRLTVRDARRALWGPPSSRPRDRAGLHQRSPGGYRSHNLRGGTRAWKHRSPPVPCLTLTDRAESKDVPQERGGAPSILPPEEIPSGLPTRFEEWKWFMPIQPGAGDGACAGRLGRGQDSGAWSVDWRLQAGLGREGQKRRGQVAHSFIYSLDS